jgi:cold shock CspA family protein
MAAPERRLSAEAKPFAPPAGPTLAKVVSRDDDEPRRRRGVIVDNLKVSYGFVRLDDDAAAQDLFLHLTDCAYDEPRAGDRVSLVVARYNNKPKAVDVQLIERLPRGLSAPKIRAENERHASRFPVPLREQVACALFAWVACSAEIKLSRRVRLTG